MPGLGDYRLRNGKHQIAYGIVSYGLVASSVYLNYIASQSYTDYQNSYIISESDQFFNQSVKQKQLSFLVGGTAVALWVADIVGILVKNQKLKKELTPESSLYYYTLSQKPAIETVEVNYLNTKNSYERAMDSGEQAFQEENYKSALRYFQNALRTKKEDEKAIKRIGETENILAELEAQEAQYESLLSEAVVLFNDKNYRESKMTYQKALEIKPKNLFLLERIAEIDKIIEQQRIDSLYSEKLTLAELALKNVEYEKAKLLFLEATELKPTETYPKQKINEIDSAIEAIEQKRVKDEYTGILAKARSLYTKGELELALQEYKQAINLNVDNRYCEAKISEIKKEIEANEIKKRDNDYVSYIDKGDKAMDNREYDKAREYYEKALALKPSESNPKNKIKYIDERTNIKASDLATLYEECKPSVFFVYTEDNKSVSQGSGFFISESGYAISNYHVFEGSNFSSALIETEDGKKYKTKIEKVKITPSKKVALA